MMFNNALKQKAITHNTFPPINISKNILYVPLRNLLASLIKLCSITCKEKLQKRTKRKIHDNTNLWLEESFNSF